MIGGAVVSDRTAAFAVHREADDSRPLLPPGRSHAAPFLRVPGVRNFGGSPNSRRYMQAKEPLAAAIASVTRLINMAFLLDLSSVSLLARFLRCERASPFGSSGPQPKESGRECIFDADHGSLPTHGKES
jgi:hypothetical protein